MQATNKVLDPFKLTINQRYDGNNINMNLPVHMLKNLRKDDEPFVNALTNNSDAYFLNNQADYESVLNSNQYSVVQFPSELENALINNEGNFSRSIKQVIEARKQKNSSRKVEEEDDSEYEYT